MRHTLITSLLLTLSMSSAAADAVKHTPAPKDARVYFIAPADGAIVSSPVRVIIGLENMGVAPAGVRWDSTGHHHILLNMGELPAMDAALPASEQIIHLGGGQTETLLELPAGEHSLQLLLGDHFHIPHQPPVLSEKITIQVEGASE